MVLDSTSPYPHAQTYVLKLHRESAPAEGRFIGRLENVDTGQHRQFRSGEELLACLKEDASMRALLPEESAK